MPKTKFKAPLEHSILLAFFIIVWTGPVLKLAGIITCSWRWAFVVLETVWVIAVLAFLADILVGVEAPVEAETPVAVD